MIGSTEILVIAIIVLVLFGASSIPKFAKSLGEAKKAYKEGASEDEKKEAKSNKGEEDSIVEKEKNDSE